MINSISHINNSNLITGQRHLNNLKLYLKTPDLTMAKKFKISSTK